MLIHPTNGFHLPHRRTPSNFTAIYINIFVRTLAMSLIGIFLPIFLFTRSQDYFGVSFAYGLWGLGAYLVFAQLFKFSTLFLASKSLEKISYKWTILWGNVFAVAMFIFLILAEKHVWAFIPAAVLDGFSVSFYWLGYRMMFTEDSDRDKVGQEVGLSNILERAARIVGPLLGGFVLLYFSFQVLFSIALILVMVSSIPFFFVTHSTKHTAKRLSDVWDWLKEGNNKSIAVSLLGRRLDDYVLGVVWPLYIFIALESYADLGILESLAIFIGTISIYFAGKVYDKKKSKLAFSIGVWGSIVGTMARGIASEFAALLTVESLRKIIAPFFWITFDSAMYDRARDDNTQVFFIVNMICASLAALIIFVTALLFAHTTYIFWIYWGLAACGILLGRKMWRD